MKVKFVSVPVMLLMAGCSLQPFSDHATVTVEIQNHSHPKDLSQDLSYLFAAPPAVNQFSCLGVNIMGQGIGSSSNGDVPEQIIGPLLAGTSYCSYPGITSPPLPVAGTQTVQLVVPAGAQRI